MIKQGTEGEAEESDRRERRERDPVADLARDLPCVSGPASCRRSKRYGSLSSLAVSRSFRADFQSQVDLLERGRDVNFDKLRRVDSGSTARPSASLAQFSVTIAILKRAIIKFGQRKNLLKQVATWRHSRFTRCPRIGAEHPTAALLGLAICLRRSYTARQPCDQCVAPGQARARGLIQGGGYCSLEFDTVLDHSYATVEPGCAEPEWHVPTEGGPQMFQQTKGALGCLAIRGPGCANEEVDGRQTEA